MVMFDEGRRILVLCGCVYWKYELQSIAANLSSTCVFFFLFTSLFFSISSQVCMLLNLAHLFIRIMHCSVYLLALCDSMLIILCFCISILNFFSFSSAVTIAAAAEKRPSHGIDFVLIMAYSFATKNPVETQRISTSIVCHVSCSLRFIFYSHSSHPSIHSIPLTYHLK